MEALQAQSVTLFPASLAEAQVQFETEVKAKIAEGATLTETGENAAIKAATMAARVNLGALIEMLLDFEMWLSLTIPQVSDGNNFGVEIQEHFCKLLVDKKTACKVLFDGLNTYSSSRSDLWGKAVFAVTEKKSSSAGKKSSAGGEKDTNETSTSEDVSTTQNVVHSDSISAIAGLDVQQYFHLKMVFKEIYKNYAVISDIIAKNIEKLKDPRGENEGQGNGMSMF